MYKTASLIFVNDLYLQGRKNAALKNLLVELKLLDYEVQKVCVVPQHEKIVTYEIDLLVKQCDIVVVVGQLNDDIVFKSLADVTYQDLRNNLKFKKLLKNFEESNNSNLPITTKLLTNNSVTYPVLQVQRIFVLNEDYLDKSLDILRNHLRQYRSEPTFSKVICILMNGTTKHVLDKIKEKNVKTLFMENDTMLAVTLDSTSFEDIIECEEIAKQELRGNFIESYLKSNNFDVVYRGSDEKVQQALEDIEKCLTKYGPENVFISFNGGKDCTVLLHLVCTVMTTKYPKYKNPFVCLYVRSSNAFPEQDKFISLCQIYYNLEVMTVSLGIKEALDEILLKKPNLKACFMGTRRTDPFSDKLNVFQMTDSDWPQVMRVSPLLDWHYSDIWDYLLYYKVPYCKLYDMGFTSLGNATNTIRNPNLIYHDIRLGTDVYLPAYKMLNEDKERSGRDSRK